MTKQQLAADLGIARATLYRYLSALESVKGPLPAKLGKREVRILRRAIDAGASPRMLRLMYSLW